MEHEDRNNFTPGPWIWTEFCRADGQPIETVDDVADTIAGSARHSERAALFGVTLDDAKDDPDGRATVVCYTGNGPNAHNNARAIAAMMTQGVALLRRLLNERDHGFVYSADRRDARALLDYIDGREAATNPARFTDSEAGKALGSATESSSSVPTPEAGARQP